MRGFAAALLFATALLLTDASFPSHANAETVFDQTYGFYFDPPEGWKVVDVSNPDSLSFSDPTGRAVIEVLRYPANRYVTADAMAKDIGDRLHAKGDRAHFSYNGSDAALCDYTFAAHNVEVRGYDVFIVGRDSDFAIITFAPTDVYNQYHDLLLSAADSFSASGKDLLYPGPISQFYQPFPQSGHNAADEKPPATVSFPGGANIKLPFGKNEGDASQVVIEREARILSAYQPKSGQASAALPAPGASEALWEKAWTRYYRMIHRDNYHRLDAVAAEISSVLDAAHDSDAQKASALLSFLQGFHYVRTDTLSDLESPVTCLLGQSGDCDSLGMTYSILLNHLGIDAVLMVSLKYSHSMVGVDVAGNGARFAFDGKKYLVAELTAPVPIGRIAQEMADPAYWLGVKLTATP